MRDPGQPLKIIGIDPGLASTGWGVVQLNPPAQAALIQCGVIETTGADSFPTRLHSIFSQVQRLIALHQPTVMAVEQLFFAKNAKTAMAVAHGRAAAILAAGSAGIEVVEYTPLQLKLALTGRGSAGKLQVQQMVKVVLALAAVPEPNHAADALAAALCHAHSLRLHGAKALASPLPGAPTDTAREARKALLAQRRR